MKIKLFFAWYDLWIGAYFSKKEKALYICLIPCCVIRIGKPNKDPKYIQELRTDLKKKTIIYDRFKNPPSRD